MPDAVAQHFKGKKITLMGLGLLGRGVGDAEFLAACGAEELIVTDLKTEAELAPSIQRLKDHKNVVYHLGGHRMEDFEGRDMIVRAPNTPLDSPFIAHAREHGIPVEMDASLFAKLSPATIVGITGTRGKSTVTHLIYEMARAAGKSAVLGGNERGTATLPLLATTDAQSVVVLELDSWQLQGFEDSKLSPHISVWTNFMPDHMNYYKGNMERYFRDKAAIARFQKPGDVFVTTTEIKEKIEAQFGALAGTCITDPNIPDDWTVALPGEHNRRNAAFARAAAESLGVSDEIIKNILKTFTGLPGRLELLGEKNGIAFYDDANSTTPEATIAALKALAPQNRPIVLIAGGSDKELDFAALAPEIKARAKKLILFNGKATDKIAALLGADTPFTPAASMDEAFAAALAAAAPGDIILLSPGATSFGIFKNEYDRGDQFRAAFKKLA
ncbi:MAG TPA: UDP-N-acetylmuramoyl-L-alanine--D-glutamate ligase [Candidatus Paceibacterota bacterium]|nr:UDP-N-acetylmuramoyl-L-alanine--D-glutamate ligase [Candidatus Paceibacterota bacterium]